MNSIDFSRITEYEERLLTDTCIIYPQSVSITAGVPVKLGNEGVVSNCLVCAAGASEDASHGLYEEVRTFYVKLPKDQLVKVFDTIVWKDIVMTVTHTNHKNTWRVLTIAECKEQNG